LMLGVSLGKIYMVGDHHQCPPWVDQNILFASRREGEILNKMEGGFLHRMINSQILTFEYLQPHPNMRMPIDHYLMMFNYFYLNIRIKRFDNYFNIVRSESEFKYYDMVKKFDVIISPTKDKLPDWVDKNRFTTTRKAQSRGWNNVMLYFGDIPTWFIDDSLFLVSISRHKKEVYLWDSTNYKNYRNDWNVRIEPFLPHLENSLVASFFRLDALMLNESKSRFYMRHFRKNFPGVCLDRLTPSHVLLLKKQGYSYQFSRRMLYLEDFCKASKVVQRAISLLDQEVITLDEIRMLLFLSKDELDLVTTTFSWVRLFWNEFVYQDFNVYHFIDDMNLNVRSIMSHEMVQRKNRRNERQALNFATRNEIEGDYGQNGYEEDY